MLFDLCVNKNISVFNFLTINGQVQFSRWLPSLLFEQWIEVVNNIYNHAFEDRADVPIWKWSKNSVFSTKSVYDSLTKEDTGRHFNHIWKAKVPYKIKIFMWLVENNVILTKDNLIRRHWVGDPICKFCTTHESIDHLFFQCPVAKTTWRVISICIGANDIPRNIQ